MNRRTAALLLVSLVLLLLFAGMAWYRPVDPAPVAARALPRPARAAAPAPAPVALAPRPLPPPPAEPTGPAPGSVADAHRAIAERLGLITVRCFLGERFDDQHFTGFYYRPSVEDGWFTALVQEPQGVAVLSIMHNKDPADDSLAAMRAATFEYPYQVRWNAPDDAVETNCTVEEVAKARLVVDIEPVETSPWTVRRRSDLVDPSKLRSRKTFHASGCGFSGGNSEEPHLEGEVKVAFSEQGCSLRIFSIDGLATVELRPFAPGEERRIQVSMEPAARPDFEAQIERQEQDIARWEQEVATLTELLEELPEDSPGHRKTSMMVAHRQRSLVDAEDWLDAMDEPAPTLEDMVGPLPDAVLELLKAEGVEL